MDETIKMTVLELILSAPMTAGEVSDISGISKPTAYKYLEALRRGKRATRGACRVASRGPESRVYAGVLS